MTLFVLLTVGILLFLGPRPGALPRLGDLRLKAADPGRGAALDDAGTPRPLVPVPALLRGSFRGKRGDAEELEAMAGLVRDLGALLSSGRGPAQAWKELLAFHRVHQESSFPFPSRGRVAGSGLVDVELLALAAQASSVGESPAQAIRRYLGNGRTPRVSPASARQWNRLASCIHASELSGCPLAGLLMRFALDLEQSADAEGARQTALAGPRASVALLGWLPFLGLGLGMLLGVDPMDIVFQSPLGGLSVGLGLLFWFLGRVWSGRLVRHAEAGAR